MAEKFPRVEKEKGGENTKEEDNQDVQPSGASVDDVSATSTLAKEAAVDALAPKTPEIGATAARLERIREERVRKFEKERKEVIQNFERERAEIVKKYEKERANMAEKYEKERVEKIGKLEKEIAEMVGDIRDYLREKMRFEVKMKRHQAHGIPTEGDDEHEEEQPEEQREISDEEVHQYVMRNLKEHIEKQ